MIYFYNYLGVSLTFHALAHTRSGRALSLISSSQFGKANLFALLSLAASVPLILLALLPLRKIFT